MYIKNLEKYKKDIKAKIISYIIFFTKNSPVILYQHLNHKNRFALAANYGSKKVKIEIHTLNINK